MAEFPAHSLSPMRVHARAFELLKIRPCWQREHYRGGLYDTSRFRTCTYCGCVHPEDMIDLLAEGGRLEGSPKPGKFLLIVPNPVAGDLVRIGSVPGPIFERGRWPQDLKHRLYCDRRADLQFEPTIGERLAGHFDRPALEPAPAEITWPFYSNHTSTRQWPEIWAAAKHGESNAQIQSAEACDRNLHASG